MPQQWFSSGRALSLFTLITWLALPVAWWIAGRAVPKSSTYLKTPADRVWLDNSINEGRALLVVLGGQSYTMTLKELTTGEIRAQLSYVESGNYYPAIIPRPDGSVLAAVGKRDYVQVLEAVSKREIVRIPKSAQDCVQLQLSPDGATLAVDCKDGTTELWDLPSGRLRVKIPGVDMCSSLFSPDGRTLISHNRSRKSVSIRAADTGQLQGDVFRIHWAGWCAFSGDGRLLALPTSDGVVVWDVKLGSEIRRYPSTKSVMAQSIEGRFLVLKDIGSPFTTVPNWLPNRMRDWLRERSRERKAAPPLELFDTTTGETLAYLPAAWQVKFLPDGTLMTYDYDQRVLRLWDVPPRVLLPSLAWRWVLIVAVLSSAVWLGVRRRKVAQQGTIQTPSAIPASPKG